MDLIDGIRSRKKALKKLLITKRSEGERSAEMDNGVITEDEQQPLSPTARLFHEPHLNCYIIAIMGSGKRIDVDVVKAGLEVTLVRHPRFSSLQVADGKGRPYKWLPTKVVLENHVVIPELDLDMEDPDQFVEDYVARLTKSTLDMSKPLWDLHLLNLKTTEAEAVGVFRAHHSLGDGMSLMSLLFACTRKTADPESLPTIPKNRRPVSRRSGFVPFLADLWAVIRRLWNTVVDVLLFAATAVFLKDTETPLKGAEGVEFNRKRLVHRTLSLDDVKMVKNAMNLTVNDVLLAVTTAGLSRYLSRRYGKGEENGGKSNLPTNIRLRATVLVNIRAAPGIHALADMMEKEKTDAKWGNLLGYIILPFSIQMRDDPLDYIRKAKEIVDRKKLSLESLFTSSSSTLLLRCFGVKAAASVSHRVLSNTTMSFSNIIGPLEEISFYGHPIVYLAPSVYGHPHALTIHFQSYMDKVKMVLAIDECAVPDPGQLCEDLTDSLKLIKEAVLPK
ncbi:wax ester synthase/diacylglycerol acyltransferase 11-like [Magnolia sinica]|uniref:wax ester synthase/diacylglycerol acyltransferase 11-like n=1 Tax=Magnolia sinica TaxID=86752 RepID=UPI002657ACBA|nr:wax ester synthase/diacylglycerol acyltransferase 11-like [Magnolia sinica]